MSESFSRSQFPPQGWMFYQPQTAWHAPTPKSSTFDQSVQLIIKHRMANPAAVSKHSLSLDPVIVGNELENYTRARLGMQPIGAAASPPPRAPRSLPLDVRAAAVVVADMARGVATLLDWLRSGGKAVEPTLAEKRAQICVACEKNGKGDFTSFWAKPVAEKIRREVEARKDLNLTTSLDEKLGVCQACRCPLATKVHLPIEPIVSHFGPDTKAKLAPQCWILAESKSGN
jgi:hypothetical protein